MQVVQREEFGNAWLRQTEFAERVFVELVGGRVEVHSLDPRVEVDLELQVGYRWVIVHGLDHDSGEVTTSAVATNDNASGIDAELIRMSQEVLGSGYTVIGAGW